MMQEHGGSHGTVAGWRDPGWAEKSPAAAWGVPAENVFGLVAVGRGSRQQQEVTPKSGSPLFAQPLPALRNT